MLLSILIPVYNERTVVERSLSLVLAAALPENMDRELVIVDDCSTDGTSDILKRMAGSDLRIRLYRHQVNQGKGAAVRTAIENAQGDFCLVQDADLEYDPQEIPDVIAPIVNGNADVVFGSRFLVRKATRVLYFYHYLGNKLLTFLSNMATNINLTDVETCYKAFRGDIIRQMRIESSGFGFEIEVTAKVAKLKCAIYETPISYYGRTYEEGKKITGWDGVAALYYILRYNPMCSLKSSFYRMPKFGSDVSTGASREADGPAQN